jgi:hypothetical protein
MKHISQNQYEQLEELYIKEQFEQDRPVPNEMIGSYGWYAKKRSEFKEIMMKEGYTIDG